MVKIYELVRASFKEYIINKLPVDVLEGKIRY